MASCPAVFRSEEERLTNIAAAVAQMKESGLRYFFGIFSYDWYDLIMAEAHRQGITGAGYYWMFGDACQGVSQFSYDPETQADLIEATHGSSLIATASPMILKGLEHYDAFVRHWDEFRRSRGPGRLYYEAKMPADFRELDGGEAIRSNEFSAVPFATVLMGYDAVISAAFAVCDAEKEERRRSGGSAASDGENSKENEVARIDGKNFIRSFVNLTYDGLYGSISIDPTTGTRIPQTVPYSVSNFLTKNFNKEGSAQVTLTSTDVLEKSDDGESQWRNLEAFIYSDETTSPPAQLPPLSHDLNLIGRGARVAGLLMCTAIILTAFFFVGWTHKHRKRRVIKSAQPVFLYILAGGAFLMGLAIVPLGIEEPASSLGLDAACMAIPWLVTVGFSLTFSALYAKTLRVNMILKRKDLRRVKVDASQVMRSAAILVCLNVVIMTLWNAIAPLKYYRTPTGGEDEFGRTTSSAGMCLLSPDPNDLDSGSAWWVGKLFFGIIIAVNGLMLVAAMYQVHRARNINTEFSESKYVKLSMFSIVQAWLIGIPLLIIGRESPEGFYVVTSTVLFIMCESILLLIFFPKIYFLREWKKKQCHREEERVRKSQTPTWMLNSQNRERDPGTKRGSSLLHKLKSLRGSDLAKKSMRNLQNSKSIRFRGSGRRNIRESEAITGSTIPPDSPPERRRVQFCLDTPLPQQLEETDGSCLMDDSPRRQVTLSTAVSRTSSILDEGEMKVETHETCIIKSLPSKKHLLESVPRHGAT